MDKEKLNINKGNDNSFSSIKTKKKNKYVKPFNKFSSTVIDHKGSILNLGKELNNTAKNSSNKIFITSSINDNSDFKIKSQKFNRKIINNINLNDLTLHDALYLGFDLNNKKIRANDISCYLSNTSMSQP